MSAIAIDFNDFMIDLLIVKLLIFFDVVTIMTHGTRQTLHQKQKKFRPEDK